MQKTNHIFKIIKPITFRATNNYLRLRDTFLLPRVLELRRSLHRKFFQDENIKLISEQVLDVHGGSLTDPVYSVFGLQQHHWSLRELSKDDHGQYESSTLDQLLTIPLLGASVDTGEDIINLQERLLNAIQHLPMMGEDQDLLVTIFKMVTIHLHSTPFLGHLRT